MPIDDILKKHQIDDDMLNDMICSYNSIFTYLIETIKERQALHSQIHELQEEVKTLKIKIHQSEQKCTKCKNREDEEMQRVQMIQSFSTALSELRSQINSDFLSAVDKPSFFRKIFELVP